MAKNNVHDNDKRDKWAEKIGAMSTLKAAAAALVDFRRTYMTSNRTSHELEVDCNYIECKIEEAVAILKNKEISDDKAFLNNCWDGRDAQGVADGWLKQMNDCTDKYKAEKIHIDFRNENKSPLMPVNVFMDTDRLLGNHLMELRNTDYYATSLPDLRKERGVKVIEVPS